MANISSEADTPDGKIYLDAVLSAGRRSRAIISIALILIVFTFTSLRNNYEPDWNYAYIQLYEDLHDCLTQTDLNHAKCGPLKNRIEEVKHRPARADDVVEFAHDVEIELRGKYSDADFYSINETKIKELETRYTALSSRDAEDELISIPVLGSQINFNDLWLVSGVLMFCLLYALRASLEQEYRNAKFIVDHKPHYRDLLVMNQVLLLPPDARLDTSIKELFVRERGLSMVFGC